MLFGQKGSQSFSVPQVNEASSIPFSEPECHLHVNYTEKAVNSPFTRDNLENTVYDPNLPSESTSLSILSLTNSSSSSTSSTPSPPSSPCISCNKLHPIKACTRKISNLPQTTFFRKDGSNGYSVNALKYPGITFEDKSKRKKAADIVLSLICFLTTLGLVVLILFLLPKTSLNSYFKFSQNNGTNGTRSKHVNRIHPHRNKLDSSHSFMAKESAISSRMDPPPALKKDLLEREEEPKISYDVIKRLDLLPTIETKSGLVQGTSEMILGKVVSSFYGIPYAKPPVKELRFRKPVPIDPWDEIYEAKEQPSPCIQFIPSSINTPWISTREHSEDCLYMNIWTPEAPIHKIQRRDLNSEHVEDLDAEEDLIMSESSPEESSNREPLAPAAADQTFKTVMVWFYGGAFFSGSIDLELYDGSYLAAAGDVVVVSVNYRLGALGFLSSPIPANSSGTNQTKPGTHDAPGNMGMYDQVLALNWIKDNIDSFGGDPDNIVLFGQSAGATSAGLHTFSPLTRDIPSRVILQSGSPLFPKIYFENSLEKSALFALKAGCIHDSHVASEDQPSNKLSKPSLEEYYTLNSVQVVECLKNLSIDQLQAAHLPLFQMYKIPFFPKPGDEFLPELPHDAIDDADLIGPQTEILIGNMRDEGSFFLHLFFPDVFKNDLPSNGSKHSTREDLRAHSYPNITLDQAKYYISQAYSFIPENQAQLMSEFFLLSLSNETSRGSLLKATYDIIGDSGFVCPAVVLSEHLANYNVSVYHYLMTERPTNSGWHPWMGSTHLDEVQLVFGLPIKYPQNYTQQEIDFSWNLINTWTTFAKTGYVDKL